MSDEEVPIASYYNDTPLSSEGFDSTGPVLWLRLYDEDSDNTCWIKHIGIDPRSGTADYFCGTRIRENTLYYFTINGSMPNFNSYIWKYKVEQTTVDPSTIPEPN